MAVQGSGCLRHSVFEGQQHHGPHCTRGKLTCYGERISLDRAPETSLETLSMQHLCFFCPCILYLAG